MTADRRTIFTIGHATHSFSPFVSLLKQHGVTVVADVRSQPYSRRFEQFNRQSLAAGLEVAGLRYVFLGEELGARRVESECYEGNRADYRRIALLPKFREGLERLKREATQSQIALMCAEKEPLDCHRVILICRHLRQEFRIVHILADGTVEEHVQTERRLVQQMDVARPLFDTDLNDEQLIQEAYDKRSLQIAYRTSEEGATK